MEDGISNHYYSKTKITFPGAMVHIALVKNFYIICFLPRHFNNEDEVIEWWANLKSNSCNTEMDNLILDSHMSALMAKFDENIINSIETPVLSAIPPQIIEINEESSAEIADAVAAWNKDRYKLLEFADNERSSFIIYDNPLDCPRDNPDLLDENITEFNPNVRPDSEVDP